MSSLRNYFDQKSLVTFEELCDVFGGEYVYIPKQKINFEKVYKKLRSTLTREDAISYIVERYGYSRRYVCAVTRKLESAL